MGALDPVATGLKLDPVASRRIGAPRKYRAPLRVVCSGKGPTGWYLIFLRFFRLLLLPIALIELTFSVTFYISLYLLVAGSPSHVDPLLAVRMYFRSEHSRLQLDPVTAHSFQAAPLLQLCHGVPDPGHVAGIEEVKDAR